jgi:hypothetical protein
MGGMGRGVREVFELRRREGSGAGITPFRVPEGEPAAAAVAAGFNWAEGK